MLCLEQIINDKFGRRPCMTLPIRHSSHSSEFHLRHLFYKSIAPNEILGTQWWSWAVSLTAIVVAFLSPFLGALSDLGTYRKRIMWYSTLSCVIAAAILFFPTEGASFFALSVFLVANISFEIGTVFCNAYLADIVSKENFGKTSGFAWVLGYVGGLLALILALFLFVQTDQPIIGFEVANGEKYKGYKLPGCILVFCFQHSLFFGNKRRAVDHDPHLFSGFVSRFFGAFKDHAFLGR